MQMKELKIKWKVAKLSPQTSHHFSETEEQAVSLVLPSSFWPFKNIHVYLKLHLFCSEFEKNDDEPSSFFPLFVEFDRNMRYEMKMLNETLMNLFTSELSKRIVLQSLRF